MGKVTRDRLVTGHEGLVPALILPPPDDRHVLASAIVGRCDAIVTQTLMDLSTKTFAPFGIETRHPDGFFRNQISPAPGQVCSALRYVRARLKNPTKRVDEYLSILTHQAPIATVADLEKFADLL